MADEQPVIEQPVSVAADPPAPAAEIAPTPMVAEAAPVVAETVVSEPAPVIEVPSGPTDLLKSATADGEPAKPVEGEKPAEAAAEKPAEPSAEKPPEGEKPVEPPAPEVEATPQRLDPLAEYKYEVPEGLNLTEDRRTEFHTAIENARNGDVQGLINLHHQAGTELRTALEQNQRDVWNTTLQDWHDKTIDQFGGEEQFRGIAQRVAGVRDRYASEHAHGSPEWQADMAAFNHMLDSTGIGNHPTMWAFMNRMAQALGEPRTPAIIDPKPAPQSRRGAADMYDNPRSPKANGAN